MQKKSKVGRTGNRTQGLFEIYCSGLRIPKRRIIPLDHSPSLQKVAPC